LNSGLRSGKLPPSPAEEPPDDLSAGTARGAGAGAWFLVGAAVVGLGIATYLTTLHYAGVAPICTTNSFVNCGSVLKSSYSVVPGTSIPVTLPGLVSVLYFVFAELVKLHQLCEWCTTVHILVFLSLLVTIARVQSARAS